MKRFLNKYVNDEAVHRDVRKSRKIAIKRRDGPKTFHTKTDNPLKPIWNMSDRMAEGFGPVDNRMRCLGTSVRVVRLRRECRDSIEVVAASVEVVASVETSRRERRVNRSVSR